MILTQTSLNLTRPLMSYQAISLGAGALAIGMITACYALLSVVTAVPLGRATDRSRHSPLLVAVGAALLGASALLLATAGTVWTVAAFGTMLGFGHLAFMIAGQGLIARCSSEHDLDRNFGWFTATTSIGQLLGPALAGLLLGDASGAGLRGPTQAALVVAGLLALAALPAAAGVWRTCRAVSAGSPSGASATRLPVTDLLRRPGIASGLFVSLALLAAVDVLTAYLPLIAEQRGIVPATVGILLSVRAAASVASRLLMPWLLRRWSRRVLIVGSALGSAVTLAVVPLPFAGPAVMAAALLVGGFLLGLGQPLTMTVVVRAVPDSARSTALALRLMGNRFGQVALPAGASLIAAGAGAGGALWFTCAVLLAAAGAARAAPRT
ncbi:MFS transporter [Marinitenerispora sediminis]|uniref:MFS transporter n=1 Tax=Marinitenerispora sediminis TaxID=1931232 RepID=UPI0028680D86|nr:MFS transporter [Marinitenerispora sediminis]